MRHHDKAERRKNAVDEQTQPHIVRLVEEYYPALLRARILRCIQRQRYGQWTNLCRHAWCPACSPRESYTRAMRQLETFRQFTPPGEKVRVAHEVYTLPPMLHAAVNTTGGIARWKRAVIGTIRELHRAEAAGVLNLHPMGDLGHHQASPPLGRPHQRLRPQARGPGQAGGGALRLRRRPRRLHPPPLPRVPPHAGERPAEDRRVVGPKAARPRPRRLLHRPRESQEQVPLQRTQRLPARQSLAHPRRARAHGGLTWAYKPKEKEPARAFDPRKVMANLLAQQTWQRGRKRHVWFGYMADNQRRTSLPRFRGEGA